MVIDFLQSAQKYKLSALNFIKNKALSHFCTGPDPLLFQVCSPLPCMETRIAQLPKQVHRSPMWHMKDIEQGNLFCKRVYIDLEFLFKRQRPLKMGKNRQFSNTCQLFSFLAKLNFLKDPFTTTLYLVDFIGF